MSFYLKNSQNRDKTSTRRHRTMLIKTINTKWFFNKLFIYRKNDNEQIDKDFIITKTSKVHSSIEIHRCRIFNQREQKRLNKILFTFMTKDFWWLSFLMWSSCWVRTLFFNSIQPDEQNLKPSPRIRAPELVQSSGSNRIACSVQFVEQSCLFSSIHRAKFDDQS